MCAHDVIAWLLIFIMLVHSIPNFISNSQGDDPNTTTLNDALLSKKDWVSVLTSVLALYSKK